MGFPFEKAEWVEGMEAIFPGAGGSMPGTWATIAVVVLLAALAIGQMSEAEKYRNHK
ncbi:MAG: hypothetical protein ACO20X_09675 [Alphaproteobacteria bacterium]|jgi:hypothetical protein